MINVTVIKTGGGRRDVTVSDGTSVEGALRTAEVDYNGYTITRDGETISLGSQVVRGDVIVLSRKVEGGR